MAIQTVVGRRFGYGGLDPQKPHVRGRRPPVEEGVIVRLGERGDQKGHQHGNDEANYTTSRPGADHEWISTTKKGGGKSKTIPYK